MVGNTDWNGVPDGIRTTCMRARRSASIRSVNSSSPAQDSLETAGLRLFYESHKPQE